MKKASLAVIALVVGMLVQTGASLAHHGWSWTSGDNIELIGIIREISLGMPHGTLQVDADGEVWTVEVGQPWRNESAGLQPGDLAEGVEIRAVGEPSADLSDRLMKAERLYIGEREFILYPDRD